VFHSPYRPLDGSVEHKLPAKVFEDHKEERQRCAAAQSRLMPNVRPLSLYLRQADESTFYSANVLLPSQLNAAPGKGQCVGLPISKDITLLTQ